MLFAKSIKVTASVSELFCFAPKSFWLQEPSIQPLNSNYVLNKYQMHFTSCNLRHSEKAYPQSYAGWVMNCIGLCCHLTAINRQVVLKQTELHDEEKRDYQLLRKQRKCQLLVLIVRVALTCVMTTLRYGLWRLCRHLRTRHKLESNAEIQQLCAIHL